MDLLINGIPSPEAINGKKRKKEKGKEERKREGEKKEQRHRLRPLF